MELDATVDYEQYVTDFDEFMYLRFEKLDDHAFDDMKNNELKELVIQLSQKSKKILWLRFWQNFACDEIALIFDCSNEIIENSLLETLKLLRLKMSDGQNNPCFNKQEFLGDSKKAAII